MNYSALKTELQTDPKVMGLAAKFAIGDDSSCISLLNAKTGPGAESLTLSSISKNDFLRATLMAAIRLANGVGFDSSLLPAPVVKTWQEIINQARAADPGSQISISLIGPLGLNPVTDKIMTQAEYDAMSTRVGSRIEKLFGIDVSVTLEDIAKARTA